MDEPGTLLALVFLLLQGAGSLFLALCLGTLYFYCGKPAFLLWAMAWLCNFLWLILGSINFLRGPEATGAFGLLTVALLGGWWHPTFWVLGLGHFQRHPEQDRLAGRTGLILGLLLIIGGCAAAMARTMPLRERNILLGVVVGLVYGWSAVLAWRHSCRVQLTSALFLAIALGLYALSRLHDSRCFLWQDEPPNFQQLKTGWAALVGCLVQTALVLAMLFYLLGDAQLVLRETVQRLEESEERFRLIFENSGVGMSLLTRDGRFLQANPALLRMLGYPANELRGRCLADFVHDKDASHTDRPGSEPGTGNSPSCYEREKRYIRKDGETIWARALRVPICDSAGCVRRYVGILIDITSRNRTEERLAASEQRYRLLNEAARDGIHVTDESGHLIDVNPAFCHMLGHDRDSLLDQTLVDLAEDRSALHDYLDHIVKYGGERREARLLRVDGTPIDVEMSGAVLELQGRRLVHSICRDVSDRKRAEEVLRLTRERLREERDFGRQVLENADVMIFVTDPAGRILHFNGACAVVLGHQEEDVCGRFFWDILLPERHLELVRQGHFQLIASPGLARRAADAEPPLGYEMHWRTRNGNERLVSWRNAIVRDSQSQARYVITTGLDVTDQRLIEEQLRLARKMETLGTLVGGIAHDFNNQLTVVLGHLGLALSDVAVLNSRGVNETQYLKNPLSQAQSAAQRCAEITQRLLTFSTGKVGPTSRENPCELLADVAEHLKRDCPGSIQVRVAAGNHVWPVVADAAQLRQVLYNLASNARDAMPHGGTLTFAAANRILEEGDCALNREARPGRFVEVTVTDTGEGMPPEVRAHLFEPFFTTKELSRGTGLGLSTAYGILKAHGGWISVQSEPGLGSSFRLYLPIDAETARKQPREVGDQKGAPRDRSPLILVVDDEELVRSLAEVVLNRGGYEVISACDGEQALEIFREKFDAINLVLLDYSMPRMTGLEAMREMLRLDPDVRVVFSSGYTRDSDADQLLASGGRAFVPKPYRSEELLQAVHAVLESNPVDRTSMGSASVQP